MKCYTNKANFVPKNFFLKINNTLEWLEQVCSEKSCPEKYSPYLARVQAIAAIVDGLGMDAESLHAALVFPLFHEGIIPRAALSHFLNESTIELIFGVQKIGEIEDLIHYRSEQPSSLQRDRMRCLLLCMVKDVRSVVIKLAEQLIVLREAKLTSSLEQQQRARLCASIYIPLANRLGIGQIKWEMEDLCFRYLQRPLYQHVAALLRERRRDREVYIAQFTDQLRSLLLQHAVKAVVYGRPKHIFSIWRKMEQKKLAFDALFDVLGVRIVVDSIENCYTVLSIVHARYEYLDQEFDDYIAHPKANGYQSLHTVVLGNQGKPIELQIRTHAMHEVSELGIAAHWSYKESEAALPASKDQKKLNWRQKLLQWQGELVATDQAAAFDDRIYVLTPQGDIVDLPQGATPLDFAYYIHSDIGHRCIGAKVDGRIVPFNYRLQLGNQVDILTQKQPRPNANWLNPQLGFITSSRARSKIQAWFKKLQSDRSLTKGKGLLETELQREKVSLKQIDSFLLNRFHIKTLDALFIGIGNGTIRLQQVMYQLRTQSSLREKPSSEECQRTAEAQTSATATQSQDHIVIGGVSKLLTVIARCCAPVTGDLIGGFITQGRGISVHQISCLMFQRLHRLFPARILPATWHEAAVHVSRFELQVLSDERTQVVKTIHTLLAQESIHLLALRTFKTAMLHQVTLQLKLELLSLTAVRKLLTQLEQIPGVIRIERKEAVR